MSVGDFLKNVSVSLSTTGISAAISIWFICVTVLGVFGTGEIAGKAMTYLAMGGLFLIGIMGRGGSGRDG